MQQLCTRILLALLLISIVAPGGALAQADTGWPVDVGVSTNSGPGLVPDAGHPDVPLLAPRAAMRPFQTRFDVVEAPAQFDQVLQIVDFPAGTWTPTHTPGGRIYYAVIDGSISTRRSWSGGVDQASYEAGQTFVARPGEYLQVGNATSDTTRVMATAVLPPYAPLTIYQDGIASNAYPTLSNWNYTHDRVFAAPGPETVYRSVTEVQRPASAFELVQLVLDPSAPWAQPIAANDESRESCISAWSRMTADSLSLIPRRFERVAANLCLSSGYMPGPGAAAEPALNDLNDVDLEQAADLYRPAP